MWLQGIYRPYGAILPHTRFFVIARLMGLDQGMVEIGGEIVAAADSSTTSDFKALDQLFVCPVEQVEGAVFHSDAFPQEILVRIGELDAN